MTTEQELMQKLYGDVDKLEGFTNVRDPEGWTNAFGLVIMDMLELRKRGINIPKDIDERLNADESRWGGGLA